MPVVTNLPRALRPYQFHGVAFGYSEAGSQAVGDCPLCGKDGKWYCNAENGLWDCKVCGASGNAISFLQQLWTPSEKATSSQAYVELARERRLLYPETLEYWGVCQSILTGDWLVPGYGADGRLCQLYKYRKAMDGRRILLATAELGHGLMMPAGLYDTSKPLLYVCEGPWDGMALYEALSITKRDAGDADLLTLTASKLTSLYASANVVAVPGANVFRDEWTPLAAKKIVALLYDSDHPGQHPKTGEPIRPVGVAGAQRAATVLGKAEEWPESILYLNWGENGYDPSKPSGYDARDLLTIDADGEVCSASERVRQLSTLLSMITPIPEGWIPGRTQGAVRSGGTELDCLPCRDWKTLTTAWRKALKWIDGLDKALAVMLSTCLSTESVGDQLWVKVVGPPSCGKSELCEAISTARKYVTPKSTIRGLFSGFQTDKEGSEDNSLAPKLRNKTLVTKDGDTLLQMPNLMQILAEFRDLYDRVSRTDYRNKMSRDYEGLNITWILCGTEALRLLDSSELGERLLDCVIARELDADLEDAISLQKAYQAEKALAFRSDGRADSRDVPDKVRAKQLTGGYVEYLRENAQALLGRMPMDDAALRRCVTLGTFVAFFRSRPSKRQDEAVQRELAFRLVSQHVRLAKCLAVVLNRPSVDEEVMRRVRSVSLDTARGRTLEVAKYLFQEGSRQGVDLASLVPWTGEPEDKLRLLLRFMRGIGAVERFTAASSMRATSARWRLTERVAKIYGEVVGHDSSTYTP